MIYESTKIEANRKEIFPPNIYLLLTLSVATSIDALAVGLSLSLLKVFIVTPVIVIGTVTFILSFLGVFVGNTFGRFLKYKIEIMGGLILIAIGVKILIEHLV